MYSLCDNKIVMSMLERRNSQVVRAAWLWCRKSPEGREFKAGFCHPTTGELSLYVNPAVNGYLLGIREG